MSQKIQFSAKQHKAIRALLTSPNIAQAAQAAGVNRKTVTRWLAQEDFKAALQSAEIEALAELCRTMAGNATKAQAVLLAILADPGQPGNVRVRAASEFLNLLPKLREHFDLESRLKQLEDKINEY